MKSIEEVGCLIEGCENDHYGRGWCQKHWTRWYKHGDPLATLMPSRDMTTEERFWSKVNKNGPVPGDDTLAAGKGPCWLWTAHLVGGYGRFWIGGRGEAAYRFAYELLVGPIPDGLQIDHLCRVRQCVRPDHLEPVTIRENVLRGVGITAQNVLKTHCPKGHSYDEENTRWSANGNERYCRACDQLRREIRRSRRELVAA